MLSSLFLLLLGLSAGKAFALDLKGHQFTDSYRYSLLEDSYSERFSGKNIFLGSYAYVHTPFYYTDENVNQLNDAIISHNNVLTLGYSRYVSEYLAMGMDVVGVQNKVLGKAYSSIGDTNLRAKYLLSDRGLDWGLSLNPFLTLPTGKKENFTTAQSIGGGIRAVLEKHLTRWHLLGSLGYGHNPKNHYEIVDQRNLLLSQLGVSFDINADWNINGEVIRNFTLNADERQDEGDYFVTVKNKTTDRISLYGGGGIAGTERVERNNYTVFAGFKLQEIVEGPAPAPAPKKAPPKPTNRQQENAYGDLIEMDNIYFANNRSEVTPVEREKIMKVVRVYRRLGEHLSKVVIEGYASKRGHTVQNQKLGAARSREVMRILHAEGIPTSKMVGVSYGDLAEQHQDEWKNRKVQFRVYKN